MTTHTARTSPDTKRPRWQTQVWFALAVFLLIPCAFVVIGAFTWVEDVNWLTFAFAAVGVAAFGAIAIRLGRELRATEDEHTPGSLWLAAGFWFVFALGIAYSIFDQIVFEEDGASWLMLVVLAVFVVLMLWGAFDYARKAWAMAHSSTDSG